MSNLPETVRMDPESPALHTHRKKPLLPNHVIIKLLLIPITIVSLFIVFVGAIIVDKHLSRTFRATTPFLKIVDANGMPWVIDSNNIQRVFPDFANPNMVRVYLQDKVTIIVSAEVGREIQSKLL